MAMRSSSFSLFFAAVLVGMVLLQAPYRAEAEISCDQVKSDLAPCATYFALEWLLPQCCPAVRGVVKKADTQANRQNICRCFASKFSTSDISKAQKLAATCNAQIPYAFGPDSKIDCSLVK